VRVEGEPILAVLGAINEDLVVSGASLPHAGETVTGGTFAQHHGGKGGNQAVAAARMLREGGVVAMIGAVGDDQLGVSALEALRTDGVQTDHVLVTSDAPTGVALIAVGDIGENQISVAPGANLALTPKHMVGALELLRPHLLLASLEVAERTIRAAVRWAHDRSVPVVLNPAPFQPWIRELLSMTTYVTPNAGEFTQLGDVPTSLTLIETLGADGARIHSATGDKDIPTIAIDAVDTTGAGDCFNGVLAAGLVRNLSLPEAVRQAAVAAALSVRVAGAREGMPTSEELHDALARGTPRTRTSRGSS
jgi:ribokinase